MELKLPSKEDMQKGLELVMDYVVSTDHIAIELYVDKLREQNKGISCDELTKKILHRKSIKNGLIGAITGVGGLITLPVSVPADLVSSWGDSSFNGFFYCLCLWTYKGYNRFEN